ncbi:MAG: initiation control protein YabA [Peptococcaceae bacterium]|jgi:regulator of replication initiation timing|nr:initiation control protein YabA [Peptococcaceae bacterium]
MSLSDKLARIEKSQRQIQEELLQARQEARLLEEENQRLRRQLSQIGDGDYQRVTENGLKIQQTAIEKLEKLYEEDFHICHLFFGRERTGECLFCRGFLEK